MKNNIVRVNGSKDNAKNEKLGMERIETGHGIAQPRHSARIPENESGVFVR
jgi:hypothetical protein